MDHLKTARGCFVTLLNALDDARADVTDKGEDVLDLIVAEVEKAVRQFDIAFTEDNDGE